MPIYEYACNQCGHRFDVKQSWSDDALTDCPECTGHIRRVLHPAGVIFKGSGWYITDSRKSSSATQSAGNGSSEKPADKPAEPAKKAESTPAADS